MSNGQKTTGGDLQAEHSEPKWILWLEWIILLAIVALATYLRYWRIEEVPPGFNSDEAVGAMGALTTLREGLKFSYEGQGGGGVLGFYFAAASFYLFGPSIAAIRGVAAWAGVVSIFANYWAIRELFRGGSGKNSAHDLLSSLNRARLIAMLGTLGLAVAVWHIGASRIAFAGIGVPFLMLPSVYFLWRGLNRGGPRWPFVVSGIFLGGLMYIYLSGVFFPPFYAIFFVAQWAIIKLAPKKDSPDEDKPNLNPFRWRLEPPQAFMTEQFWNLFATGLTATILLLPLFYVLLFRPDLDPGAERARQAFFMNPQINQGNPWGLLLRSIVGNFSAYGVSFSWLMGQTPRLTVIMPPAVGAMIFFGWLIAFWRGVRGQAAYLFIWLWFLMLLLPSILAPDAIPHNLRTIGATTPAYIFAAIFIVWLFETLWAIGYHRLPLETLRWAARGVGMALAAVLIWILWTANARTLYDYFYVYPQTNDAQAAYHLYAVRMAEYINQEDDAEAAFVLPRNTAAGDVFKNFTTDFLVELEQPPASHYWVIDNEETLAQDLTTVAAEHNIIRLVRWKTSKHTGADPKEILPYFLEKYGHYQESDSTEYFDVESYRLEMESPDFQAGEAMQSVEAHFGDQIVLTGYALGNAGDVEQVDQPTALSNDLLWLRLSWRKSAEQSENLKVSALIYGSEGQLIIQVDKLLLSNILQRPSRFWEVGATEETYFLIPIPPATPPGPYTIQIAVYGEESLQRLTLPESESSNLFTLDDITVQPAQTPLTPDDLELALPAVQELLPGVTLIGFETLPGETVRSGDRVGASLIWQAGDPPPDQDIQMALWAKPEEGEKLWPLSEPIGLSGSGYPTSEWQAGQLLRGWLEAKVPPALEPGLYKLQLQLTLADDPEEELLTLPIGDFQVEGWPRNFEPPQPEIELEANFNDLATLVGLDMESEAVSPGETLVAQLHWRAEAEFEQNYTAFIHLIGPDGLLYGQVDHIPGGGTYPTTGWLPGEYITDAYTVPISPEAPSGPYQLEIGLYDSDTGQRLLVGEGDDKILLPGLTVE